MYRATVTSVPHNAVAWEKTFEDGQEAWDWRSKLHSPDTTRHLEEEGRELAETPTRTGSPVCTIQIRRAIFAVVEI